MDADNLVINADNDVTTGQLYLKFNNSGTASENGLINWDIDNEKFIIDDDIDLNGTTTVTGQFNASTAAGFRMRQTSDVIDGTTVCNNLDELILDTSEDAIYVCTGVTPTNTWGKLTSTASVDSGAVDPTCDAGANGDLFYNTADEELKYCDGTDWQTVGPQDFEQVFATDADKTLTTNNQTFTIDSGTQNFDVTNTGQINFDTGAFDIDATTFDVTATTLNLTGTNVAIDSGNWDITSGGIATFVSVTADDITGNDSISTGTGAVVNFSNAASVRTREVADIATAACTAVGDIVLDTSTSRLYTCTVVGTPGTFKSLGGNKSDVLTFNPEFPNNVVDAATGTSANKGTLSTVFEDATNRQHYRWATNQPTLQDINLKFKIETPTDFSTFGNLLMDYRTFTSVAADANVDIIVRDITNLASPVTCATVTGLANSAWTTNTITAATLNGGSCGSGVTTAGDIIEISINLAATNGADFAHVGQVKFGYNN